MADVIDIGAGDLTFLINADLKHWGGRRGAKGPYEIDYERFANQASDRLGEGGVVGVPNARGPNSPLGAEYRFEELLSLAKKASSITQLGDGRVFYDNLWGIWFVKCQEINTEFNDNKLTYLSYNIPAWKNLKEKDSEAFENPSIINVLNLTSCISQLDDSIFPILGYFSGIVVHSSSATFFERVGHLAEDFYNSSIKGKYFSAPGRYSHLIGAVAVSGGHRTPKENLFQKIVSPISIGSSYTPFSDFKGVTLNEFNDWLRYSIEHSQNTNVLGKGSSKREMLSRHLPRMCQEVLYGRRRGIFSPQ